MTYCWEGAAPVMTSNVIKDISMTVGTMSLIEAAGGEIAVLLIIRLLKLQVGQPMSLEKMLVKQWWKEKMKMWQEK